MTYGGEKSLLEHVTGTWATIPGNGLNDDQINNQDKDDVWYIQNGQSGYLDGDFNMDGVVNLEDIDLIWKTSAGRGYGLPANQLQVDQGCGDTLLDSENN